MLLVLHHPSIVPSIQPKVPAYLKTHSWSIPEHGMHAHVWKSDQAGSALVMEFLVVGGVVTRGHWACSASSGQRRECLPFWTMWVASSNLAGEQLLLFPPECLCCGQAQMYVSIEQLVFFFFFVVAMTWSRIFPLWINLMLNLALDIILKPENEIFLLSRVMYSRFFQFDLLAVFFGRK